MKVTKVCVIGDLHDAPAISKDRLRWLGKHIKNTKPDQVVQIGDFMSLDSCCWHIDNATMQARRNKGTFIEDIESFDIALAELNKGLGNYKVKKHVTLGNHENRLWKWEDRNPEYYNIGKRELFKTLKKYGWTASEYGEFYFIDGVGFTHVPFNVMGREFGGVSVERNIGQSSLFDVVFGHTHKFNGVRCPKIGNSNYIRVVNVGCSLPMNHIESYAKLSTTGWFWGVVDISIYNSKIQEVRTTTMDTLELTYGR